MLSQFREYPPLPSLALSFTPIVNEEDQLSAIQIYPLLNQLKYNNNKEHPSQIRTSHLTYFLQVLPQLTSSPVTWELITYNRQIYPNLGIVSSAGPSGRTQAVSHHVGSQRLCWLEAPTFRFFFTRGPKP